MAGVWRWRTLMLDADGFAVGQLGDGDPVEAVGGEVAGHEVGVGAYGDLVGVGVDVEDVEGLGRLVRPRPLRWPTVKEWMPAWWPMTSPVVVTSSPEESGSGFALLVEVGARGRSCSRRRG